MLGLHGSDRDKLQGSGRNSGLGNADTIIAEEAVENSWDILDTIFGSQSHLYIRLRIINQTASYTTITSIS